MLNIKTLILILFILSLSIPTIFFSDETQERFEAKVVNVLDGDTIIVLTSENMQIDIRLADIDCPEKNQAFGQKAKQKTKKLVLRKKVTIIPYGKDQYGRIIAEVVVGKLSLNDELLRSGLAWWYKRCSPNNEVYKKLENQAKQKQLGLWSVPNPIPPWEFRYDNKDDDNSVTSEDENNSDTVYICKSSNIKRYHYNPSCKELSNCSIEIYPLTVKEAEQSGRTQCRVCY